MDILNRFNITRNAWLTACFALYVGLMFLFASVYYKLFSKNPQNFSFNSDILRSQTSSFDLTMGKELGKRRLLLEAFRQFSNHLDSLTEPPKLENGKVTFALESYSFVFSLLRAPGDVGQQQQFRGLGIIIYDKLGNEIGRDRVILFGGGPSFFFPNDLSLYREMAFNKIKTLDSEIREGERRLMTLANPIPEVWSYWDFLYFSTITQTTVGYGDILPNSTLVRLVVITQIIVGLAILTVVINLIFLKPHA